MKSTEFVILIVFSLHAVSCSAGKIWWIGIDRASDLLDSVVTSKSSLIDKPNQIEEALKVLDAYYLLKDPQKLSAREKEAESKVHTYSEISNRKEEYCTHLDDYIKRLSHLSKKAANDHIRNYIKYNEIKQIEFCLKTDPKFKTWFVESGLHKNYKEFTELL